MPVCSWPNGTTTADSFSIMRELHGICAPESQQIELAKEDQQKLEELFFSYALARTRGMRKIQFIREWSAMPTEGGGGLASCFRALMCLYFLVMITFGRSIARKRKNNPNNLEHLERQLEHWTRRLEKNSFLSGLKPGALDCALMGQIQCMTTGLTDDAIPFISENDVLMAWIERMQEALEDFPHDFTHRIQRPEQKTNRATVLDQTLFWSGLVLALACFPVTLIALGDAIRRRKKNPARSGAVLSR